MLCTIQCKLRANMVKDRLEELRRVAKFQQEKNDVSVEIEVTHEQKEILKILDRFSEISSWIRAIEENVDDMRLIISGPSFHYNNRDLRNQMEAKISHSLKNCKQIHIAIKDLESEVDESDYSALSRIKRVQFLLTKDYYIRIFREHEEFLQTYDERIKKIAQMEAKIMSVALTEEETESLLKNQGGNQCFVGNVLQETEMMRMQLRDLVARHNELENLEKSLIEVRDLFLKISSLVMEQGALIQVVEFHAQQATMNVEYGAVQLEKAKEKKIATLKKKYCILTWVVVILSFLIIILLFAP